MLLQSPAIILPKKKPILNSLFHGKDEYNYDKSNEHNKYLGKRGWQIWFFNWNNQLIKRFIFDEENDAIELFLEVHAPGFDSRKYEIPPEQIGYIQLFFTQALTTGAGTTQNFSVPPTWGFNTISCIGGGGDGTAQATFPAPQAAGYGGGAGAFASLSNLQLDRNGTAPYFVGKKAQASWFKSNSTVYADFGTFATINNNGAGLASNSIGTITHSGGGGAKSGTLNVVSGVVLAMGGGGGGAGSSSAAGSTGAQGNNTQGGKGGDSDTASGGNGGTNNDGSNGANGTDFDSSHGSGAGGGGGGAFINGLGAPQPQDGGNGGNYGSGGGGAGTAIRSDGSDQAWGDAGVGIQGMIWLSWSNFPYSEFYQTS